MTNSNTDLPPFMRDVEPWERRFLSKFQIELVMEIHRAVVRSGVTQKELADRAGWSEPYVSRLLSGDQNLTLKTVARLEEALGADLLTVVGHAEPQLEATTVHNGEIVSGWQGSTGSEVSKQAIEGLYATLRKAAPVEAPADDA